ncbi:NYN domain-containing protein [Fervidibacillus albus]|uniref:NYN domain-containing protein n=1 Tax=Fervidibacillus albus TaxID=2980026 RepID=A0A9E8LTP2_9BACI|nr:NYN domain-containing protein [Fervidibacillus albus]WAA09448.1 NYN domain-containing protein [Fervidibacillus albus]
MDILIVDGYNMIGAWPELQKLRKKNLALARNQLIDLLADYQAYTGARVIVVFDAYIVKGTEKKQKNYRIEIIYTKEKETADEKIEKLVLEMADKRTKVFVATSDFTEQWAIFGQGAYRKSARELYIEIQEIKKKIRKNIKEIREEKPVSKIPLTKEVADFFEKFRRGQ